MAKNDHFSPFLAFFPKILKILLNKVQGRYFFQKYLPNWIFGYIQKNFLVNFSCPGRGQLLLQWTSFLATSHGQYGHIKVEKIKIFDFLCSLEPKLWFFIKFGKMKNLDWNDPSREQGRNSIADLIWFWSPNGCQIYA